MNFDYNTYKIDTFVIPLCILILLSLSTIFSGIRFISRIKEPQKEIPIMIISLIIIACFSILMAIQLSHGVRLVKYGEKDPAYISGEIQEITDVPISPKYWYDNEHHHSYASWIKINNEKYYIMAIGNFKVGDTVQIKYLNKSNFVLSIDYFNHESMKNIETNIFIE